MTYFLSDQSASGRNTVGDYEFILFIQYITSIRTVVLMTAAAGMGDDTGGSWLPGRFDCRNLCFMKNQDRFNCIFTCLT